MTRAKRELIFSFHGAASQWIRAIGDRVASDFWNAFETVDQALLAGVPESLPEFESSGGGSGYLGLTGAQFLYVPEALGLSIEAQDKLSELVDGRGLRAAGGGRRLKWPTVATLAADLMESRRYDSLLGSKVADEIRTGLRSTSADNSKFNRVP
jgi:hypothetical protein